MINGIYILSFDNWNDIREIFLQGIRTRNATFQTEAPTKEEWFNSHIRECSIGYFNNDSLLGWATLSKVSSRCVYSGVAEVSVYINENFRGQGIGDSLMKNLIKLSEKHGYWTLQAGIFPENESSIKLHISNGFRQVGRREKLGKMNGTWRDVYLFERRSIETGQD
jgi:L-amino acid N-acyltransferase YncA